MFIILEMCGWNLTFSHFRFHFVQILMSKYSDLYGSTKYVHRTQTKFLSPMVFNLLRMWVKFSIVEMEILECSETTVLQVQSLCFIQKFCIKVSHVQNKIPNEMCCLFQNRKSQLQMCQREIINNIMLYNWVKIIGTFIFIMPHKSRLKWV